MFFFFYVPTDLSTLYIYAKGTKSDVSSWRRYLERGIFRLFAEGFKYVMSYTT